MQDLKAVADYLEGTAANLESLLLDDEVDITTDAEEARELMQALRQAAVVVHGASPPSPHPLAERLLTAARLRYGVAFPDVETFAARLLVETFQRDDDEQLLAYDADSDALAAIVADLDNETCYMAVDEEQPHHDTPGGY